MAAGFSYVALRFLLLFLSLLVLPRASCASRIYSSLSPVTSKSTERRKIPSATTEATIAFMRGGAILAQDTTVSPYASLIKTALSAVAVYSAMWLVLVLDIRTALSRLQRRCDTKTDESVSANLQEIANNLRKHRIQKLSNLKGSLPPLTLILLVACIHSRSFPWQVSLWDHGPSATALGLNFAYWAVEIAMDTALDECGTLGLYKSAAFSGVLQLILIAVLITGPRGHIVFWLKATETMMATALARLVDHPFWIGIASLVSCFVTTMALMGQLAPLPPSVPVAGASAYFGATLLASTGYQFLQNDTTYYTIVANIKMIRAALCCLSMWFTGVPPSWIIYDAINFFNFFGLKVVTDTVALLAIGET